MPPLSRPTFWLCAVALSSVVLTPGHTFSGIQNSTPTTATLSNTNFLQTDADALQTQLDALTAELTANRNALAVMGITNTTYATLQRTIQQQEATAAALQLIITQLLAGKTVNHYTLKTAADGSLTLTVTYTDNTTTESTIPGDPTTTDSTSSSSSGGISGSGSNGGNSNSNIANMLGGILGQLFNGGMANALTGSTANGLNNALTGLSPQLNQQPAAAVPSTAAPACKPRATTDTAPGKKADDDINANGKTTTGSGTTNTHVGKAADDDIHANGSTAAYLANKAAADKAKQAEYDKLPFCQPPQVDTPTPQSKGGTDTGALNGSQITSEADARQLLGKYINDSKSSAKNAQECASLTKALTGLGRTTTWTKGEQVFGNTNLAIGTPIATFCSGNSYGVGKSGCSHTGIYLGQSAAGVRILHQWNNSGGARIDTLPWSSWGRTGNEGGMKYYTINSGNSSFLGVPWYLPSLLAGYTLPLQGEGLALSFKLSYTQLQPTS